MTKTDLRSRLESRLARMVADARAFDMADMADLADDADAGAAIVIDATMAEVEAIASRLVPDETIRAAVMARLAERSDLVAWARPWTLDRGRLAHPEVMVMVPREVITTMKAELQAEIAHLKAEVEGAQHPEVKQEGRHPPDLMTLDGCSAVWKLMAALKLANVAMQEHEWTQADVVASKGFRAELESTAFISMEPMFLWGWFNQAIDAVIPHADRDAVSDVMDRHTGPWRGVSQMGMPLGTARLVAWFFLQETTPHRLAEHAAKAILAEVKDDIAARPAARRELAREVEDHLEEWASTIAAEETIDEALAGFLERIGGGAAKKAAADVRQSSAKRSEAENAARWAPGAEPLRVARLLARALWADAVAPRLQRLESTHPALARVVHIDVVGILRPGLSIRDDYVVDTDGRQRMMFTQSQALDVPTVEMGALPRLLRRGLELFGSIQAHRIVRHVVVEGHRRAITGEADPRVLRYQGGWSALAAQANVTEADDARAIVVALAHAAHELTDGTHGNLLAYTARRGSRGRPGLVSLTLGDMLLPHFVHSLDPSKARTPTENRRLVPIVDFAGFVGRNNDHAAQATLQMMFMARLRDAAAELAETGAVRITDVEFAALAHDAGLTPALLPKVLDRWTHNGGDAPAFMVKAGDRYTLAPHFAPALAFLEAAGQMSLARSKAGKLSAARKGKPRRKKPAAS